MKLVISDSGRGEAMPTEKNDCTVRALANVLGMPYMEAHTLLAKMGRPNGEGYAIGLHLRKIAADGIEVRGHKLRFFHYKGEKPKVIDVIGKVKGYGRWIIQVDKHVFAVINGVVYDDKDWAWQDAPVISACQFLPND